MRHYETDDQGRQLMYTPLGNVNDPLPKFVLDLERGLDELRSYGEGEMLCASVRVELIRHRKEFAP